MVQNITKQFSKNIFQNHLVYVFNLAIVFFSFFLNSIENIYLNNKYKNIGFVK